MAYASEQLRLIVHGALSGITVPKIWCLDTTDAIGTVNTSNYISDGYQKGMGKGDLCYVRIWNTIGTGAVSAIHLCWVIDVETGTDELGVDLTDGLAITATDTD